MDIQLAVRMLYSTGDLDRTAWTGTISAQVRRNELSDKREAADISFDRQAIYDEIFSSI